MGKGNFFKEKVFLSPHPFPSKNLKQGVYFFVVICALIDRTYNVRTNPRSKVLVHLFQKVVKVKGRIAPVALRRERNPPFLPKTQESVNFFGNAKERGRTLVGGSP